MYGPLERDIEYSDEEFQGKNGDRRVTNELTIQNLIMIASNTELFKLLDIDTQQELERFIKLYTKSNLERINKYSSFKDPSYAPSPKIRKKEN